MLNVKRNARMAKLGRRMGLKTPGQKCRVGSIPTSGTTKKF